MTDQDKGTEMTERETKCEICGRDGYWLSSREDELPEGHDNDLILCGGDVSGLRPDRPYCEDCIAATEAE